MFNVKLQTLLDLALLVVSDGNAVESETGAYRVIKHSSAEEEALEEADRLVKVTLVLIEHSEAVGHVRFLLDVAYLDSCSRSHCHVLQRSFAQIFIASWYAWCPTATRCQRCSDRSIKPIRALHMYLLREKALLLPLFLPLHPRLTALVVIKLLHYYVYYVGLLLLTLVQVSARAAVPQILYYRLSAIQQPDEFIPL